MNREADPAAWRDDLEEGLDVVRPAVLVVEIVGMLPDIDSENRDAVSIHKRIVLIGRRADAEAALTNSQPCPTTAEASHCRLVESGFELLKRAE